MNIWEIAILRSIDHRGGEAANKQIYTDLESGAFINLTENDLRRTQHGNRKAYQNQVRSHLANLKQSKDIQKVSHGVYAITAEGMKRIEEADTGGDTVTPHIRIFPHSQEEFPFEDDLTAWLLTALRGGGGVYHLRRADRVKNLPPGSLVLFRYGQKLVGEAVVRKGKEVFSEKLKIRALSGKEVKYEAQVTFAPSSIRLYAPPIAVQQIQPYIKEKDLMKYAGVYVKLDWAIYARILAEVISRGVFVL